MENISLSFASVCLCVGFVIGWFLKSWLFSRSNHNPNLEGIEITPLAWDISSQIMKDFTTLKQSATFRHLEKNDRIVFNFFEPRLPPPTKKSYPGASGLRWSIHLDCRNLHISYITVEVADHREITDTFLDEVKIALVNQIRKERIRRVRVI